MKKFLVMLMVVAMASFLFVGCLPGTTTPVTEEEEEEEEVVTPPTTVAPIITAITDAANVVIVSLTSTATQYMNKAEVANGIIVHGTAPTYSEVKVYIDDICAGTGNTADTGIFEVVVAKADLGADAADKAIYATAKEVAIDVSAHSVEYAFVLDTDLPGIDSVAANANQVFAIATVVPTATGAVLAVVAPVAGTTSPLIVTGVWTVNVLGTTGVTNNVQIIDPNGVITTYTCSDGATFAAGAPIPGVQFTLVAVLVAAQSDTITCVAETAAIAGRATLKFDEDVSYAAATAATCVYGGNLVGRAFVTYKEINDTNYWTITGPAVYTTAAITVRGVADLAGNVAMALFPHPFMSFP